MQKDNTKKQETVTEVTFVQSYSNTIVVKEEGVFENGNLLATGDEAEPQKDPTEQAQNLMRKYYRDILSKPFDNIVILTGAGTSKSSGGKIMKELWDEAFPEKDKVINETFFTLINFPIPTQDSEKNIEELLCQSQRALKVLPSSTSTEVSNKI
jgi:hypothetical protein